MIRKVESAIATFFYCSSNETRGIHFPSRCQWVGVRVNAGVAIGKSANGARMLWQVLTTMETSMQNIPNHECRGLFVPDRWLALGCRNGHRSASNEYYCRAGPTVSLIGLPFLVVLCCRWISTTLS